MADVRKWLDSLGLGQYADAFAANDIDGSVLGELDHDVLKDIGVASAGHRLRIIKAARGLAVTGTPAVAEAPAAPGPASVPPTAPDAERRQLTVMFADLAGSTALAERLDPEVLSDVTGMYQQAATAAITANGGYVARYMGDGVLAYFGFPVAREDDAERAVRAALSLVETVPTLPAGVELAVRVGVATGQVVVGQLVGEGAAREHAAVGGTPNLAARAQGEAPPNGVVIAGLTYDLVAGLFDCDDLGAQPLKGFEHPQQLWRVRTERAAENRFEAMHGQGLIPFIGRAAELALLAERWRNALDGEGQVVTICGEPGIGKSRLSRELRRVAEHGAHAALRYQCSSFHTNSAFQPFIEQLRRAAQIAPDDDARTASAKLASTLNRGSEPCYSRGSSRELLPTPPPRPAPSSRGGGRVSLRGPCSTVAPGYLVDSEEQRGRTLALLAALLSVSGPHLPAPSLAPEKRKAEIISTLRGQLAALCSAQPVLLLFEDAHWADPSSLEVLDALVDEARGQPVLIIVTHRPEFPSRWMAHGHVSELRLSRLTQRDGAAIIAEIAHGARIPDSVVAKILHRTDGVPLFVEELTKTVLESSALRRNAEGGGADSPWSEATIPSTLRDSLMARLDYLEGAKEVAQIGACMGREFSLDLVHAVSGIDVASLREALDRLVDHHIVFERSGGLFTFKHALVQDAAYDSLLLSRRSRIHVAIVAALEVRHGSDLRGGAEILAYHCRQAGLIGKAVHFCRLAGEKSNDRSAYREALRFLEDGLELVRGHTLSDELTRELIYIRLAMRPALGAFGRYEELLEVLAAAEASATLLGDDETATAASIQETHVLYQLGRLDAAIAKGEKAVALAARSGRRRRMIGANAYLGMAYFVRGDLHRAIAITLPDAEDLRGRYRHEMLETTATSSVNWLGNLAGMHAMVGQFGAAMTFGDQVLAIAEETEKPFDQAMARVWLGFALCVQGRFQEAIELVELGAHLATSYHLDFLAAWHGSVLGYAYWLAGESERGREILAQSRERAGTLGLAFIRIICTAWLSLAECDAGRLDAAREHAQEALHEAHACGFAWCEALALRSLAAALAGAKQGNPDEPEALWHEAISVAKRCDAAPYVAQAQLELGAHLAQTNRAQEARPLLDAARAEFLRMDMQGWLQRMSAMTSSRDSEPGSE